MNKNLLAIDYLKISEFEKNNPNLINSYVYTSFILNEENLLIYQKAIGIGDPQSINKLEETFKKYLFNLRFTSYLSTSIHFAAINFDKKQRLINSRFQLSLDKPIKEESNLFFLDLVPEKDRSNLPYEDFEDNISNIENAISDEKLFEAILNLTENQRKIIELAYIDGFKDVEIGQILNKSQQTVSKSHQKALKTLKEFYSNENETQKKN